MDRSEQINELAAALAKARGEFPPIPKHRTAKVQMKSGGQYSYAYADIADVLDAVTPSLSRHGVFVHQRTVLTGNEMNLETMLVHESGQFMSSLYPVCTILSDHKAMGAALTYARRYSLTAALGVAADDDVDGEDAARVERPSPVPEVIERSPASQEPVVSPAAIDLGRRILAMGSDNELDELKAMPFFKSFWSRASAVDRSHITYAVESLKSSLEDGERDEPTILDAG